MTRLWAVGTSFLLYLAASHATAQTPVKSDSIVSQHVSAHGVDFTTEHGMLHVSVLTDAMVHVEFEQGAHPGHPQPWIVRTEWPPVPFTVTVDANKNAVIATKKLRITALSDSAALVFADEAGNVLLRESPSPRPRELTPATVDGEKTFRADAYFDLTHDESLYGMGQRQSGLLNLRGTDLLLMQDNTNITVPLLLSSQGYGLLWNYASLGRMENHFQPKLALRADVADGVDYFFIYGPKFDEIIAAYRWLTGESPMLPRFAYGFWQSRFQYNTQQDLLDVAKKYRDLKIPIDVLVLDANWMTRMGANEFTKNFPDSAAMFAQLHEMHVHPVLSEWPLFTPPSANFDAMLAKGYFVSGGRTQVTMYDRGSRLFDAFNADGRKTFWQQMQTSLFDKGVEGWWLDSSEPLDSWGEEQGPMLEGAHTALGSGSRYANLYPFFETKAVYEGQRATTDQQRVVILTRSAFLGQQRNAAIAWSGDIATTFDSLRRQIPAGLNYSMSGLPYWTTDIGGFVGGDPDDPGYRELYVRWIEYGTFCPIFRTHGARKANELWSFGAQAQETVTSYDRLRYRLLPYIYSTAWRVTSQGYTPMRALVMDFPLDTNARDITDQFMFGPAMLVNPVVQAGATVRMLYLPAGATWFDFWTGQSQRGGRTVQPNALIETIPVYVRAGAILPMGPELQWTSEKPADPIELRIYPGADGDFTLYEDDGTTYGYEKGEHATIAMRWDDSTSTLTISERHGSFPGILEKRTFDVVLVGPGNGIGGAITTSPLRRVTYDGNAQAVQLPRR
jgi:alpha-D-xyloside xylohydrolase